MLVVCIPRYCWISCFYTVFICDCKTLPFLIESKNKNVLTCNWVTVAYCCWTLRLGITDLSYCKKSITILWFYLAQNSSRIFTYIVLSVAEELICSTLSLLDVLCYIPINGGLLGIHIASPGIWFTILGNIHYSKKQRVNISGLSWRMCFFLHMWTLYWLLNFLLGCHYLQLIKVGGWDWV